MPEMLLEEGYVVNLGRSVSSNSYLSFLPWLMCACYDPKLYMSFVICHAIFTEVLTMYFCDMCGE